MFAVKQLEVMYTTLPARKRIRAGQLIETLKGPEDEEASSLRSLWRTFWLGDLSLSNKLCKLRCKDAYLRELALGRDQIRRPYGFLFRQLRSFVD